MIDMTDIIQNIKSRGLTINTIPFDEKLEISALYYKHSTYNERYSFLMEAVEYYDKDLSLILNSIYKTQSKKDYVDLLEACGYNRIAIKHIASADLMDLRFFDMMTSSNSYNNNCSRT